MCIRDRFLTGLALLSAPALLIGISPKYQDGINVDWRHGYIPQTVESFGVGLMAVAVFVVLLRFVRGRNWWPKLRPVCSVLLLSLIHISKHRIEQTMDTLVHAFETQLDQLFAADAMDISADIDVMQNMLRADGLTGDTPFKQ